MKKILLILFLILLPAAFAEDFDIDVNFRLKIYPNSTIMINIDNVWNETFSSNVTSEYNYEKDIEIKRDFECSDSGSCEDIKEQYSNVTKYINNMIFYSESLNTCQKDYGVCVGMNSELNKRKDENNRTIYDMDVQLMDAINKEQNCKENRITQGECMDKIVLNFTGMNNQLQDVESSKTLLYALIVIGTLGAWFGKDYIKKKETAKTGFGDE